MLKEQQILSQAVGNVAGAVMTYTSQQAAELEAKAKQAEQEAAKAAKEGDLVTATQKAQEATVYQQAAKEWQTGGSKKQAATAVATALSLIVAGKPTEAVVAGAASPYVNEAIKKATDSPELQVLNIPAHILWGAVEAQLSGGSATTGAVAAGVGEVGAKILSETVYGKSPTDLTETEKQELIQAIKGIAGVAGGVAAGSDTTAGTLATVSTGMTVAENAVEFNAVNKKQAGIPDGFEEVMNTSGRKIGLAKGDKAEEYLLEFAETEWFKPTKTGYFNQRDHRYIYTEEGGWIDMVHFLFYAGTAYKEKKENIQMMTKYVGNTIADDQLHQISAEAAKSSGVRMGYKQEMFDALVARHSRFSYEDLPSDKFGADFGANYFDKNSPLSLGEQVNSYLTNRLKATLPTNSPNYKTLPEQEQGKHSGIFNYSTSPIFIKKQGEK